MGVLAFGSVILDAQSQGAGRHQWDVNVINAVKIAKVSSLISRSRPVCFNDLHSISILDRQCRLDYIRPHHRDRKACHPFTVQKDFRGAQAQSRLLRHQYTHLD